MDSKLKIFMDLDPLVYGIGFASQRTDYEVVWVDEAGDLQSKIWEDGNEKLKFFREHKEYEILEEEKHVHVEPVSHALSSMKRTLNSIQRDIAEHHKVDIMDTALIPILGGSDNFRMKVAKQKVYKGNRKQPKPVHYDAIREYLLLVWHAQLTDGNETDDEMSIQARDAGGVVATVDKDLDQIPGYHYDYKKKVFYEVDEYEAMLFFYQQAISGDSTDNIPGAWKIGAKKAETIILETADQIYYEWKEDPEGFEQALWQAVLTAYRSTLTTKGCPYTVEQVKDVALETARLVKMQEFDDQLWTPPGLPDASVKEFLNE
jgi:hypothetical protein